MIFFKSRLYREEMLRAATLVVILAWAITATAWAISKRQTTLLIALGDSGARIVVDEKDRVLSEERVKLVQQFTALYLNYSDSSHETQIAKAADLMSSELWERERPKILKLNERLKHEPLIQSAIVESIDLSGESSYEVVVKLKITQRAQVQVARVKLSIELASKERTSANPWAFEIKELHDELL